MSKSTTFSKTAIDDFLIPYAAHKGQFGCEMDLRFGKFRKAVQSLQPDWVNLFKGEYIGHRIFRKGGLIKKISEPVRE